MHEVAEAEYTSVLRCVWSLSMAELDMLASAILGNSSGSCIRGRRDSILIARRHLPTPPARIEREFTGLGLLAIGYSANIQSSCSDILRLVAAYHLKFQMIHPLKDGNGRVGRAIMAAQFCRSFGGRRQDFLNQLRDHENDYKMVFVSDDKNVRFELLVDVILRISGFSNFDGAQRCPLSI